MSLVADDCKAFTLPKVLGEYTIQIFPAKPSRLSLSFALEAVASALPMRHRLRNFQKRAPRV
jgi:hypothetical protein